jgi:hypothetical protein
MAFSYNDVKSALDQAAAATGGKFVAFDAAYYVQHYSIVKDESGAILDNSLASFTGDPLKHYVETGAAKGYAPNAWFDATFYRAQYADVRDGYTNADLIAHYALFGVYEGRAPSSLLATFDGERYLRDNPEVADYVNGNLGQFGGSATNGAIAHFVLFGAKEGRHGYTTAGADTGFTYVPTTSAIAPVTAGNTTEMSLNTNGGATTLVGNNAVADGDAATAGADTLRLVGDADVRIDMTNPANQLRGVDLNGDGSIAANGIENNVSGVNKVTVKNFEIVDAYARNPLNEGDRAHNFTGDIDYDGTGFDGDGVSTDGNIVLGGMGADIIKGGIGNDFIAGGGVTTGRAVADSLSGGRNADFFFAELSELDNTDGNATNIDGGLTSDDSAAGNVQTAQDSDWLLLEASDDDEPVTITLRNGNADSNDGDLGAIATRDGAEVATLYDIENLNASGNLYGFLNGVDVEMGGRRLDNRDVAGAENYGLGSSAQLNVDGSGAANIIIAGYDNDNIEGNDGNDLLFGGDLRYIKTHANNPNLANITNDGMDYLSGDDGDDSLVLELDRGVVDGGDDHDTVYLTDYTIARPAATEAASNEATLADGKIRLDLGYVDYDGYRGYNDDLTAGNNTSMRLPGRHDTADQTNYVAGNTVYTTITDNDSIVATGLGDIDYQAAGSNNPLANVGTNAPNFSNQQNYSGINANLELRGTDTGDSRGASFTTGVSTVVTTSSILNVQSINNVLYANTGNDVVEGRQGNDLLSGGAGVDDFVFGTADGAADIGDDIDVIWAQKDADGNGLWDASTKAAPVVGDWADETRYTGDFGQKNTNTLSSFFRMTLTDQTDATEATASTADDKELSSYITAFESLSFTLNGQAVQVSLTTLPALTYANVVDAINTALEGIAAFNGTVSARIDASDPNSIIVEDTTGRAFGATADANFTVRTPANTTWTAAPVDPAQEVEQDRLVFKAYEDRADNEGVDDDVVLGSTVSLGADAYAQDRVVHIDATGTRIAEDQAYAIVLNNVTTEDVVTIKVNGVEYKLTVGVDLDGNRIAIEDSAGTGGASQADIMDNFGARLAGFINTFMDDDTAAGQVGAIYDAASNTLALTQQAYHDGEASVFMELPTVTIQNKSGGEPATFAIVNAADHEVLLYKYDGTDGNLNAENVLFVGEEFERNGGDADNSRSVLATAKDDGGTLLGSESMVVNGGADDLVQATVAATAANHGAAGVVVGDLNLATNLVDLAQNFTVHGDDFLIGGQGGDTILAGTGDDRVQGSKGTDTVDGGENLYAVRQIGSSTYNVEVMNTYDAGLRAVASGVAEVVLINQTEDGENMESGLFQDTLVFEQADFEAGKTRFTVTLNNFTGTDENIALPQGGAGTVAIDVMGDGAVDAGQVTTFTNFEHIRTISGVGRAVAGDGQGKDTLDVSALSSASGGVIYNMTGAAVMGTYAEAAVAEGGVTVRVADDFESDGDLDELNGDLNNIIAVDGVENVIAGNGDDALYLDETEAAKDNTFNAGSESAGFTWVEETDEDEALGDRVSYYNDFGADTLEPTVKINVGSGDTDTVVMTAGRVGSTVATDTLIDVEVISLLGNTAQGTLENDEINVTALTDGATVNYVTGAILDADGDLQLAVENLFEVEFVKADGDDTVIVADAAIMGLNARSDLVGDAEEITLNTFLTYDFINENDVTDRLSVAELFAGEDDIQAQPHPEMLNFSQFNFEMGTDNDTIDYSQANDDIAAVVNFTAGVTTQYVMVDAAAADFAAVGASDRIDRIVDAENIVASQGRSILDLTNADQNLKITFSNNYDANGDWDEDFNANYGREIHEIKVANATTGTSVISMNYLDYVFVDTDTTDTDAAAANARWTDIEGSDFNETVEISGWEAADANTLNLRGGGNRVSYEGDSVAITIDVVDYDETDPANTGLIQIDALHTAPGDDHDSATVDADVSATDVITSYSAQNEIAAGSLTIKGARGDEDAIVFSAGLGEKYFLLGGVVDATSAITVTIGSNEDANSLQLIGFEQLTDADTDDVYDMGDLDDLLADLTLNEQTATDDVDTIMVEDDAVGYDAAPAHTISLEVINDVFGFDFDVLDITSVTEDDLVIVADDDDQDGDLTANQGDGDYTGEFNYAGVYAAGRDLDDAVILGNLDLIDASHAGDDVEGFDTIWLTNASITSAGTTYVLDIDNGTLYDDADLGAGDELFDTDSANLNFSRVTGSNLNISVVSAATAAELTGGAGNDTITGAGGGDRLTGGAGNDTLDGSFVAEVVEVHTYTLSNDASNASETAIINGFTVTEGVAVQGIVVAEDDVDAIGAAFVREWDANPGAFDDDTLLTSVTYDQLTNALTFTFTSAAGDAAAGELGVAAGSVFAVLPLETTTTGYSAQAESADTYVFAATAALNGADTLNNVDASDTIDFSAFFGAAAVSFGAAQNAGVADINVDDNLVSVAYNLAALTADNVDQGDLADGEQAVVIVTADANGAADATLNPYLVYFVEDGAVAGDSDFTVTLVGTINGNTANAELTAADIIGLL